MAHEAEEIIRTELVQPFMRRTVTRESLVGAKPLPPSPAPNTASSSTTAAASSPAGDEADEPTPTTTTAAAVPAPYRIERLRLPTQPPPRDGTNLVPLTTLYNRILEFVERECGIVLDVAERVLDSQVGGVGASEKRRRVKKEEEEEDAEAAEEEEAAVLRMGASSTHSLGSVKEDQEGDGEDGGDGGSDDDRITGFQVLNNVVVDEIAKAITSELGGVVFAAGRPTVFHQVRSLFDSFLSPFSRGNNDISAVYFESHLARGLLRLGLIMTLTRTNFSVRPSSSRSTTASRPCSSPASKPSLRPSLAYKRSGPIRA